MKLISVFVLAISLASLALPAVALNESSSPSQSGAQMEKSQLTFGTVQSLEVEQNQIKLKHEEIKNLGMPGMTMTFQVENASLLDGLSEGDDVHFKTEMKSGAFVITYLEKL